MKLVVYRRDAAKALRKLPEAVQKQIVAALHNYAETGQDNVTKLVSRDGARLRSGNYRAVFLETPNTIEVIAVGHRKDIYR